VTSPVSEIGFSSSVGYDVVGGLTIPFTIPFSLGTAVPIPLEVKRWRITLDESWAPYCQGEIVIVTPETARLDLLDPRGNPRLQFTTSQEWTYPVRPEQTRSFDVLIRERRIDHAAGTTTLVVESDEAYLIDGALVADEVSDELLGFSGSLRSIISEVLDGIGTLASGDADFSFDANLEALLWEPGVTAWDFLQPLVEASGLRLFCDEQRVWRLVDPASYKVSGQVNIAATVNLTRGEDTISRYGDWYDSVVVKYSWSDILNEPHVAYDSAGAPGTKTLVKSYDRAYPGAGAAAAILSRTTGRGRVLALGALADFGATPGKSLIATLPDTPLQSGVISTVEWSFESEGELGMTIRSRGLVDTPDTAWVRQPEGYAWEDVPADVPWDEYETPGG